MRIRALLHWTQRLANDREASKKDRQPTARKIRFDMDYEYVSWNRFYRLCGVLYGRIARSGFVPDQIVAIARGGYPPGRVMADFFGLMDLVSLKIEHYRGPDKLPLARVQYPLAAPIDDRRVLLVDDVSDSGDTFAVALEHLRDRGVPAEVRTAVLHHKQTSSHVSDYWGQRLLRWRWITYPWAVVEDVSVLASRLESVPKNVDELERFLSVKVGLSLPSGVLSQIGPAVLDRLSDNASARISAGEVRRDSEES